MVVKRIVANIATQNVAELADFYRNIFGLEPVMDQGWIATLASGVDAPVQISMASQGGSGTLVPAISIEVDDIDAAHTRATSLNCDIPYPLTQEPWGVRRFYIRDPAGTLINVLAHS